MSATLKQFFALLILIAIGVALFYAYKYVVPQPVLGCTTEAKICPDGSTVGRTGPQCEFAVCPHGDAPFEHVGVLTATDSGTPQEELIFQQTDAPGPPLLLTFGNESMCVFHDVAQGCIALNLSFASAFDGKHAVVTGIDQGSTLLVRRLEVVAATSSITKTPPATATASAAFNESVSAFGLTIMPLAVIDDSRCPRDVQCFAAGTVHVKVRITSAAGTSEPTIELGQAMSTPGAFITLTGVLPEKFSTETITPADYRFTLEITKR